MGLKPSAPRSLIAAGDSPSSIRLSWQAPSKSGLGSVKGYRLYKNGVLIDSVSSATRTHTFIGLLPGTTYVVAVAAYNAWGTGPKAEAVAMTEMPPPPPPVPPKAGCMAGELPPRTTGNGADPATDHVYMGPEPGKVKTLHLSHAVQANSMTFNMRPKEKPLDQVHAFKDDGAGLCSVMNAQLGAVCGTLKAKDPVAYDRLHVDMVTDTLTGKNDWLWDAIIVVVKSLNRVVLGTVWHEALPAELMPGQTLLAFSDVNLYVWAYFKARGVTNVRWVTCPMASQYEGKGGDAFHSAALLAHPDLWALGADAYLDLNASDPETHPNWKAFENYHPEMRHVILEWGLRDGNTDQAKEAATFAAVHAFIKARPNYKALVGWFVNNGPGKDNSLGAAGKAGMDTMLADAATFTRVVPE